MKKIIIVLSLFVGTLTFSQASEVKIREFIKIIGADKMATTAMQQYIQGLRKTHVNVPDEFWSEFTAEVSSSKMIDLYIPIYAKYYTESDIDELIKFYKSPIGQKTLEVMPSLIKESMEAGGKMGRDIAIKVKEKLDRKEGYQSPPPPMPEKSK
ncbi:hypothetical protein B0A69_14095 [Chryseobacterium shigense]|uniref:DUF2059 domain-containing protein n=1 Tax=Chryseobacterium shigense TaxID=297244 RepID=A0A1N7JC17_9FLAO|nr:DUF2059 domain-containing protein [Chryseobacterium shigense]PQA92596.1 hypothetical protein B0A69_14095 [Chryseobacterium shigense]SIS46922.1 hypothetical protein SAMN05421639_10610 [Chryseobacterium shigense]